LKLFELWDRKDAYVKTSSGGMKRRLEIARGFLHTPKILFLDEPTLGLDPQSRNQLWTHYSQPSRRDFICWGTAELCVRGSADKTTNSV
jgi:ABC-type multidrug transport system ATPase subunit